MRQTTPHICRNCTAYCPLLVTIEEGVVVKVEGNREAPLYEGYICPKGRTLPEMHNHPSRLLHCLAKDKQGGFERIASAPLLDEIEARVRDIVERYGPNAIATYAGTGSSGNPTGAQMAATWAKTLGSTMNFHANTIDKPAASIANVLHGAWNAGPQRFQDSDTWLVIGANPLISRSNGVPANNPGMRIKEAARRGMKLIVIDPRRTETAQKAHIHLHGLPGEDPAILAGLVHVILRDGLEDKAFLAEHVEGLEMLREAVSPFTPEFVGDRARLDPAMIEQAARTFATASRGCAVCSTGPSFATRSNLSFYLTLCLNTICGRWARAGDIAPHPNVLTPAVTPKAQARAPLPVIADGAPVLKFRNLRQSASGMPTTALPDQILSDDKDRIRALFVLGGNPILAFPDQARTIDALRSLELLVVFDGFMSATAEYADYIIAAPMPLEVPAMTYSPEMLKYLQPTRGFYEPYGQYSDKAVDPPAGSDIVEEGRFFFRLAQRFGLQINWVNQYGWAGGHLESPTQIIPLDMTREPSIAELLELKALNSRIPLDHVKQYPNGHVFDEEPVLVQPADSGHPDRLDVGAGLMMQELGEVAASPPVHQIAPDYPFLLVSRRANRFNNSIGRTLPGLIRNQPYNPLHIHPEDMAALNLATDQQVELRSRSGHVRAVVEADETMKRGVVSMTQGFGSACSARDDADPRRAGASVTRLVSLDESDPITGIPRMSAIPVTICASFGDEPLSTRKS